MLARLAPASLSLCGQSFFIHLLRSRLAASYRHLSKGVSLPAGSHPSALLLFGRGPAAGRPAALGPAGSAARPAAP